MKPAQNVRTSKQVRRAAVQSALILFCVFIGTAAASEDHPSVGRVKIAVYNYSAASKSTLNKAEREASRILSNAGFETDWVLCRVPLTAGTEQSCAADSTLLDIRVRITNHPQQNTFGDGFFGFAAAPVWATAFYDPALGVAKADEADYELPLILGSTIAHEIGHLLLGPNAHSVSGIMQAEWKRGQLDQILKRRLAFTPEQASIIRSEFAIRLRLQTTSTAMGAASFFAILYRK